VKPSKKNQKEYTIYYINATTLKESPRVQDDSNFEFLRWKKTIGNLVRDLDDSDFIEFTK
jgi:hypothetical protein